MTSRWARWSSNPDKPKSLGLQAFMEAAPGAASAAEEAKAAGLSYSGYGYWRDRSGQVVAQTRDGKLVYIDQTQDGVPTGQGAPTPATLDMGNPTSTASGMTPAAKARSMGLVSDGSGSYKDQQGNTVARTVNNELVFYDSRGGGGAVSDGSGGALITQSSPSWVDPETGLITVPPAQPESPEEVNAVPDPVPAQAPAGYDAFVNHKKKEIYRQNYLTREAEKVIQQQQAELDEKYSALPAMQEFKTFMDQTIADAEGPNSTDKSSGIADYARLIMEEEVDDFRDLFEAAGENEEVSQGIIDDLVDYVLDEAHYRWFQDTVKPQFGYDPNNPEQSVSDLQGYVAASNDPEQGGSETNFAGRFGKQNARNKVDDIQGIKSAKKAPNNMFRKYNGNLVEYDLKSNSPIDANPENIDDVITKVDEVTQEADEVARSYGIKDPNEFVEVSWDVGGEGKPTPDNPLGRKTVALDALTTWRRNILPNLEPGVILWNTPTGNDGQRARIYELAGFGPYDESNFGQYGLVVQNEKGQNIIVPLMTGSALAGKVPMQESLLKLLDNRTSEQLSTMVYEGLFK